MGSSNGKTIVARRKIDECTSNSRKKKKLFGNKTYVVQKCEKGNANKRPTVKTIPQRKRPIWGLDKIHCRPVILTPRPYQPVCVD
ncbi:unnamed protein product [Leptidea sinapis]|uniref:Uncharacterized protein n=1 Tax=Leptidea sinapis TaxID=189913 RepID=A0A5E4QES3_9NEOP|nr:unnamed protein product [Leptidea sinapis]